MSKFAVHKNSDYTIVCNHILRDKRACLRTKALLITMMSLPEDWDFSIRGLASLNNEDGVKSIQTGLNQLEKLGYLKRTAVRKKGHIVDWSYDIFEVPQDVEINKQEQAKAEEIALVVDEKDDEADVQNVCAYNNQYAEFPQADKPHIEKVDIEKVDIEKGAQLNTNIIKYKRIKDRLTDYACTRTREKPTNYLSKHISKTNEIDAVESECIKFYVNALSNVWDNIELESPLWDIQPEITNLAQEVERQKTISIGKKIVKAGDYLEKLCNLLRPEYNGELLNAFYQVEERVARGEIKNIFNYRASTLYNTALNLGL